MIVSSATINADNSKEGILKSAENPHVISENRDLPRLKKENEKAKQIVEKEEGMEIATISFIIQP